jgi:ferredoxin
MENMVFIGAKSCPLTASSFSAKNQWRISGEAGVANRPAGSRPRFIVRFQPQVFQPSHEEEVLMKVKITEQCMGDRNCNKLCPEVFEYDEDQLLSIVKFDEIPAQYEAVVRQAAQECGADAIIIEE